MESRNEKIKNEQQKHRRKKIQKVKDDVTEDIYVVQWFSEEKRAKEERKQTLKAIF